MNETEIIKCELPTCGKAFERQANAKGRRKKYCSRQCVSAIDKERVYARRASASAVTQQLNAANLKAKPILNKSKNRIYDADGEFNDLIDRQETKRYAAEILAIICKAKDWISAPKIRRQLDPSKIRMWDAAISLLCDDIETKNVTIPHFRYCLRAMKPKESRRDTKYLFNGKLTDKTFPLEAMSKDHRKAI